MKHGFVMGKSRVCHGLLEFRMLKMCFHIFPCCGDNLVEKHVSGHMMDIILRGYWRNFSKKWMMMYLYRSITLQILNRTPHCHEHMCMTRSWTYPRRSGMIPLQCEGILRLRFPRKYWKVPQNPRIAIHHVEPLANCWSSSLPPAPLLAAKEFPHTLTSSPVANRRGTGQRA